MPVVICPECENEQIAPRELEGLKVDCEKCGAEFKAVAAVPKKIRARRSADAAAIAEADGEGRLGAAGTAKAVGLLVGLVALVLGVGVAVVYAVKPTKAEPTAPATQPAAKKPPPKVEAPSRDPEKEERDRREREEVERQAVAAGVGLGVLLAILLYVLAVFGVGVWVAFDAGGRGMSPLGWASFYYLFHLLVRGAAFPFATIAAVPTLGIGGLLVVLFVEPFTWVGLIAYFAARRGGRQSRCANCGNSRLSYLVTCPHCGVSRE